MTYNVFGGTLNLAQSNPTSHYTHTHFCLCNFDPDRITSIYEHDLNIQRTHLHTESELSRSRLSKVSALKTDTHMHATKKHYHTIIQYKSHFWSPPYSKNGDAVHSLCLKQRCIGLRLALRSKLLFMMGMQGLK